MSLAPPPPTLRPTPDLAHPAARPAPRGGPTPAPCEPTRPPRDLVFDLLIVAVAFALRVWSLGAHSLWLDEALAVLRSSGDLWTAVQGRTPVDLAPPLYPLLLHLWASPAASDFWLRFPSTALSLLAVVAMLKLPDRRIARVAAAIMAVAPTSLMYAQEVTVYGLVALASAALLVTADRAAAGSRRAWLAFAGLAIVGLYSYYGLGFLTVGLDAWLLAQWVGQARQGRRPLVNGRELLAGHGLVLAACLPLLPLAAQRSALVVDQWWGRYGTLEGWVALDLFVRGAISHGLVFAFFPFATPPGWLVVALVLGLAWGAFQRPGWFVGGWLLPLALTYLASAMGRYPFEGRYLLIVAPTVYALLGAGFTGLTTLTQERGQRAGQVVGMGGLALFLALLLSSAPALGLDTPWASGGPREELRPLLAELTARRGPTDGVYVTYGAGPAARVYQGQGRLGADAVIEDGWFPDRVAYQAGRALAAAQGSERLWVLISHARPDEEEALATALARRGAWLRQRVGTDGAALLRFDLPP